MSLSLRSHMVKQPCPQYSHDKRHYFRHHGCQIVLPPKCLTLYILMPGGPQKRHHYHHKQFAELSQLPLGSDASLAICPYLLFSSALCKIAQLLLIISAVCTDLQGCQTTLYASVISWHNTKYWRIIFMLYLFLSKQLQFPLYHFLE